MVVWTVTPAGGVRLETVADVDGRWAAVLLGLGHRSVHLEVALSELSAGGRVPGHLHPFEESFFVLEGEVLVALGGARYRLGPGGFGVVPSDGRRAEPGDPTVRHVAAFSEDQLPPAGMPLAMLGLRAPAVRTVSVWMLVDELLGAGHHTLFVVQYAPGTPEARPAADRFHPFQESFYFLRGEAVGRFEDEQRVVGAGDLAWTGVGALHAFANRSPDPVPCVEIQAPPPPPSGAFFFKRDWVALGERSGAA